MSESKSDLMWRVAFATIFLICFALATSLVTLIIMKNNAEKERATQMTYNTHVFEKRQTEGEEIKFIPEKANEETSCQFGFDFLSDRRDRNTRRGMKKRRLLPEHLKINFTGALVNQDLMCLDTMDATESQWIGIFECHGQGRNQAITFTTDGLIMSSGPSRPLCVALKNMVSTLVVLKKCNKLDETQVWSKDSILGLIKPIVRKDYCLNAPESEDGNIVIDNCNIEAPTQRWQLVMNEVLALWVDGSFRSESAKREKKIRNTRKQMDKLILQNKPTPKFDDIYDPLELT